MKYKYNVLCSCIILQSSINQSSINQSSINQSNINQSSINQSSINQSLRAFAIRILTFFWRTPLGCVEGFTFFCNDALAKNSS